MVRRLHQKEQMVLATTYTAIGILELVYYYVTSECMSKTLVYLTADCWGNEQRFLKT